MCVCITAVFCLELCELREWVVVWVWKQMCLRCMATGCIIDWRDFSVPHSASNHTFASQKVCSFYTNTLKCLREVQNPGLTHTHTPNKFCFSLTLQLFSFSLCFLLLFHFPHNSPSSCFTQTLSFPMFELFSPLAHIPLWKLPEKKETHPLLRPAGSCWLKWQTENRRVYQNDKCWAFQPNACDQYDYCSD